jgi:hypothetical protein
MVQSFPVQIYSDITKGQVKQKQEKVPALVSPNTCYKYYFIGKKWNNE